MRSLADRMRTYEQQKARLAETEAKLKEAERRAHTRHMIEIGGFVEKAGLGELPEDALFGALLSLREKMGNAKQREQWSAEGSQALEESRAQDTDREPILLVFRETLDKDAVAVLRAGGFRFNRVLQHWEGLAQFDAAEELASAHGGTARRVTPSAPPPAPRPAPAAPAPDPE